MGEPVVMNDQSLRRPRTSRWRRYAIGASIVFHALLLIALAVWYVGRGRDDRLTAPVSGESAAVTSGQSQPQQPSAEVTTTQVAATLERATEYYEEKSDEENLSTLEEQAAKLEQVSSEKSIDEISENFHAWMKTAGRASEPTEEPVAGEFDFDSAQIHEVHRESTAEGSPVFRAVLVDAAGRTMETEMSPEEGERAYETLQKLKDFPLANKVYRQIAMPLIDKALAAGEKAPSGTGPSAPELPQGEDDRNPFE